MKTRTLPATTACGWSVALALDAIAKQAQAADHNRLVIEAENV
jgi:hypothetical protein